MLSRRTLIIGTAATTFLATSSSVPAWAAAPEVYTGFFSSLAVGGYDPVAYFSQNKPVKGSDQFIADYKGATWQFASVENRDLFLADPVKYAPQYGGHCAYAVAIGQTAKGNPENWKIVDGKLYLNINSDIQSRWEANQSSFIVDGDANWPNLLK